MISLNDMKSIFIRCLAVSNKKDSPDYDNEYLIEKLIFVMKKIGYDTITLIETLDDIYADVESNKNRKIFMKFIEETLAVGSYGNWEPDEALLKVAKFN